MLLRFQIWAVVFLTSAILLLSLRYVIVNLMGFTLETYLGLLVSWGSGAFATAVMLLNDMKK
jgi:hypothetical protein